MRLLLPTILLTINLYGCAEKTEDATPQPTQGATDTSLSQDTDEPGLLNTANLVDAVATTVSGNAPDDLYNSDVDLSYAPGSAATFTCDDGGC